MARTRPNPPAIHMLVAMLVVLLPALLAVWWFQRVPEPPIARVDPAPVIERAVAAAPYAVAVPTNLPEGWTCTRARWTPVGQPGVGGAPAAGNTVGLGYLTPQQMYIGLDQRDAQPDAFVTDTTNKGSRTGESQVAGRAWERWVSADSRTRSLVLRAPDSVTIVSGDLGFEALEAFAGTLRFQGR